ncbi:G-type lectin S-receptor-like serine/threonine-protein kinase LECRK4 [Vitis riparia]|uniref:G-type lectin S-receptor-like serine/threonine-protein kinase LECRK4 n=1 Tax=Vitis riparia TaxID=96939 RepID=UPI00155AF0F3|nr:G-type lectin S-receptor-like serine/threonine-protein kinase LECRK4 [Vitis riparia]
MGVRAQTAKPKLIELGSSLSPTNGSSSWVSPSGHFAFGFYPQDTGFAVGVWLVGQSGKTVVWTANRDDPPVSSNTALEFTRNGKLLLRTGPGEEVSIADVAESAASASMLDSGGFFLSLQSGGRIVSYPYNMGVSEDPYWTVDARDLNDKGLLSSYDATSNVLTLASNISSDNAKNETIIYRATLDVDGVFRLYSHSFGNSNISSVSIMWSAFKNPCDVKGLCGVNGLCSSNGTNANCSCVPGFVSINREKYSGCYRSFNNEEGCRGQEPESLYNITTLRNVSWEGANPYSALTSLNEQGCSRSCLQDCNCWAAYYFNGTCRRYKLPLVHGIANQNESGITFLKMSLGTAYVGGNIPAPRNQTKVIESNKKELILILASSLGSIAFLCALVAVSSFFIYRSQVHRYRTLSENAMEEFTLRSFSYNDLEKATDGFREELGRGPFGAVYKGTIAQGNQTIAVKRLEKVVEEGEREFQAEMTIIGRTHHRNLVRLLGFCMQGSKKLLVYEYMSNGSLADLLFNGEKRPIWRERVRIALDVARGIFYLHEECEVHIIHGDIKPKNILLDDSWTAKLSDFRLARLLRPNQTGTISRFGGSSRGYSAPERQKRMLISVEADVYSFGVVLLEIVCCRSNLDINVSTGDEILLCSWVYSCFVARELEKLVEGEEVNMKTLERMVKVGLLCIQDDPSLRPTMKNVILMLEGTVDVPVPPSPTPLGS